LFVNGRRAIRTHQDVTDSFAAPIAVDDNKYTVKKTAVEEWDMKNVGNVEMVFSAQGSPWSER